MSVDIAKLNEQFGIARVLEFKELKSGLAYAEITGPVSSGRVYVQGAHVAAWQPKGFGPVIFMSRKSDFLPGKPIRGGVPLPFPWFAADTKMDRVDGKPGPQHGFARIQDWTVAFAALAADELHMTFTLGPTEMSRSMGFDQFRLKLDVTMGRSLTMALTVTNDADKPLVFEEGMHTYFEVGDIHEVSVTGLEQVSYIDKTDNFKVKPAAHAPLTFTGFTDRVYPNTATALTIHDPLSKRTITNTKKGSNTTVVFNPWRELPDLGPDEWHEMVAVETVNAGAQTLTLAAGKSHTMEAHITVEAIKA